MTLGIIDVGTNSIHLLVGVCGLNGRFHVILKERDLTRLGEGGLAKAKLTRDAMDRTMGVLRRYAEIMKQCRVEHVEAVATSAVRDAANGRKFVNDVRRRLKLPLRVVSGKEEARLIHLGVLQAHRFRRPTLIVTVGGGSAQTILADRLSAKYLSSVPLGGQRLAQAFIRHDPALPEEIEKLTRHVRKKWRPVAEALRRRKWSLAVATSATLKQLMMAAYFQRNDKPPKKKKPLSISRKALEDLVEWLAASNSEARIQMDGVDPRREDLLLPAGIALLEWMEACGVGTLHYAPGSLREGLVVDYWVGHYRRMVQVGNPFVELFSANGSDDFMIRDTLRKK